VNGIATAVEPGRRGFTSRRLAAIALPATASGRVATAMALLAVATALFAPLIAPYGPNEQSAEAFSGIVAAHWLGTDELGRDTLSRVIYGTRADLYLALIAVPVGAVCGMALGLSGLLSRTAGQTAARLFDVIIGFPTIILGIGVAMVASPGLEAVALTIAVVNVPVFGRLARASMLVQLGRDYVTAARALGASKLRILWCHVLPNIASPLVVQGAIAVADAVFIEGSLSILGLGIQPPAPSLGSLVQSGLPFVTTSPLYVLAPTFAVAWVILSFNLNADSLKRRRQAM
jgi:peptide/nickel transport system permease protein